MVELTDLVGESRLAEYCARPVASRPPHDDGPFRFAKEGEDLRCQLDVVLMRHEQPRPAILHDLGDAVHGRRHDRDLPQHRFHHGERQALPVRAEDEHIERPQQTIDVAAEACEMEMRGHSALLQFPPHPRVVLSLLRGGIGPSHDQEARIGLRCYRARRGPGQRGEVLLRLDPCNHPDEFDVLRKTELAPHLDADPLELFPALLLGIAKAIVDDAPPLARNCNSEIAPGGVRHEDELIHRPQPRQVEVLQSGMPVVNVANDRPPGEPSCRRRPPARGRHIGAMDDIYPPAPEFPGQAGRVQQESPPLPPSGLPWLPRGDFQSRVAEELDYRRCTRKAERDALEPTRRDRLNDAEGRMLRPAYAGIRKDLGNSYRSGRRWLGVAQESTRSYRVYPANVHTAAGTIIGRAPSGSASAGEGADRTFDLKRAGVCHGSA